MKIQERSISPIEAVQRAEAKPAADGVSKTLAAGASVKLSSAALALADDASEAARSQHIQALKAAYERGDKIVDHGRIADAMLLDAEETP